MKKAIQFIDVLGNKIQLKTTIDTFRQVKNIPYWIVESRKIFPQITKWDNFYPLKNNILVQIKKRKIKSKNIF